MLNTCDLFSISKQSEARGHSETVVYLSVNHRILQLFQSGGDRLHSLGILLESTKD